MPGTIEETLAGVVAWERATFPHATVKSRATHLQREADEVKTWADAMQLVKVAGTEGRALLTGYVAEELADCLMLLATIAAGEGIDLGEALRRKFAVVQQREYGPPDADGVSEHVRGDVQP